MLPLDVMLKELHLSGFKQQLSMITQQAIEHSWGYDTFLSTLCEGELAKRFQTRTQNWCRESKLNVAKRLATLELKNYSTEVAQSIRQLQADK